MKLVISNLSHSVNESELREVVSAFGNVIHFDFHRNQDGSSSRAWLEVSSETGQSLLQYLNGDQIKGQTINIEELHEYLKNNKTKIVYLDKIIKEFYWNIIVNKE